MTLPWVRLDSAIASHDKVLYLLSDPSPKRWQAMVSYVFALGWAGAQGTDGHIPSAALAFVHGTPATARLLVKYRLWEEHPTGFLIHNYVLRQEMAAVSEGKRVALSVAGHRASCARWHGPDCGCWRNQMNGVSHD